jgi:hypothetical protein
MLFDHGEGSNAVYDFIDFHKEYDRECGMSSMKFDFKRPEDINHGPTRNFIKLQTAIYDNGKGNPEALKNLWKAKFRNTVTPEGRTFDLDFMKFLLWSIFKNSPCSNDEERFKWLETALDIVNDRFDLYSKIMITRHLRWIFDNQQHCGFIKLVKTKLEANTIDEINSRYEGMKELLYFAKFPSEYISGTDSKYIRRITNEANNFVN